MVSRIFTNKGTQLFYLRSEQPRYFASDRDTGELIEIDGDTAAAIERSARKIEASLAKKGYTELSHVVQVFVDRRAPVVRDGKQKKQRKPSRFRSLQSIVEEI